MFSNVFQNSTSNTERQRIFGSAENAVMRTSLRHQGYMKVGVVLHLNGPKISLEALELAVKCLQTRHPFLRSRLQQNLQSGFYFMEEDSTLRLKIVEISRKCKEHLNFWRQTWREREKDTAVIGQGLVEFWLLQDLEDTNEEKNPREIVVVAEHSICDGLSLSTLAHELLIFLAQDNQSALDETLEWPTTMEAAIKRSSSIWNRANNFRKLIIAILHWWATRTRAITRIPLTQIDFPLDDLAKHSQTEASYGILCKQDTQKLLDKCHRYNVTVTSAVTSALLCAVSMLDGIKNAEVTQLTIAFAADTRRRCVPPVPNHDLSYQVSGTVAFPMLTSDIPKTTEEMWHTSNRVGEHLKKSIDAGQIQALGMIMGYMYQKNMGPINLLQMPTCGISNWGALPFHERYGKWDLMSTIPMGNMIRSPIPFLVMQTVNGELTMGWIGSTPLIDANTLTSLCDYTMYNLRQMIDD